LPGETPRIHHYQGCQKNQLHFSCYGKKKSKKWPGQNGKRVEVLRVILSGLTKGGGRGRVRDWRNGETTKWIKKTGNLREKLPRWERGVNDQRFFKQKKKVICEILGPWGKQRKEQPTKTKANGARGETPLAEKKKKLRKAG